MGKLNRSRTMNSRGLTLVEVLAALTLLSVILTLSISIFMVGANAVERQSVKADMQDSVTLAMKDITKEIRSATSVTVESNKNILKTEMHVYQFSDNKILKDNLTLAENIGVFSFSKEENLVSIKIESIDKNTSLSSKILIRE